MTELEQARGHLRSCQAALAKVRPMIVGYWDEVESGKKRARYWESQVKAALSWVWDAQERERATQWHRDIENGSLSLPSTFMKRIGPEVLKALHEPGCLTIWTDTLIPKTASAEEIDRAMGV